MKNIEDNDGTKYKLEDNRLFEVIPESAYQEYREVRKTDLRRALKKGTEVDYRYSEVLTKAGKLKNPESINVNLYADENVVNLGCRTFEGKYAKALVRWATA